MSGRKLDMFGDASSPRRQPFTESQALILRILLVSDVADGDSRPSLHSRRQGSRVCVSAIARRGDPQMWRSTRRADRRALARAGMTQAKSAITCRGDPQM